jgi:hypothetical protein
MVGGTALVASAMAYGPQSLITVPDYVSVRLDVILQYERTILELQGELLHYRRLLSRFDGQAEAVDDHGGADSRVRLDAESVRVVNSIAAARVSESASFLDFQEGEL